MFQKFGLSLYLPHPRASAHVVKTFPETEELYIFCNRFLGKGSGRLIPTQEVEAALVHEIALCARCIEALEATIERLGVLRGQRPQTDWEKAEQEPQTP